MAQTADYEVLIEGKAYPWNKDTLSIRDIRELANMPTGRRLWRRTCGTALKGR
jgi:hypothetical protein